jgi:hypothetical protein
VLVTAGHNVRPSVRKAHAVRTLFLFYFPDAFVSILAHELMRAVDHHGGIVARLNVASDIRFERIFPSVFDIPGVDFYDYTKAPMRQRSNVGGRYRLVYSVSERAGSERNAVESMRALANAAVVFERTPDGLPATWKGFPVVNGDLSDDRTLDPPGAVVGLLAKGSATHTVGTDDGFVRPAIDS